MSINRKGDNDMIVILMGMSAVGKDSVRRVLEREYGYRNIVSYTSRGMRVGEEEEN